MGGQKNAGFVWTPTKRRGPIAAEFSTPGPAAIGLPPTFGSKVTMTKARSPAFTISGRHEAKASSGSPGPGQYNINGLTYKAGKDEPHAPSMHIRPKDPKPFVTPAPGDYCPEKSKKVLDPSPKFSFGIKTDSGSTSDIPGPGSYNEAIVDKYKTIKSPAFSMGQRTNIPSDHTQKPGPGSHSPEKFMKETGPKFTIAPRLTRNAKSEVPGPGTYNLPDLNTYLERMPAHSIVPRHEAPQVKNGVPSPNAYYVEKCGLDSGPKWTIAARLNEIGASNVPGPGTYEAGDLNLLLDKQPAYTMRPKTEIPSDKGPKPSPNAYYPEKYSPDEGPKWTISGRLKESEKVDVPGPGHYEAGDLNIIREKNPSFTLRPKTEIPSDKSPKPSPNAYYPEKCMPDEAPKWTMAPKTEIPSDKSPKPSPNAYNPDESAMVRKNPEFSFGIKHSPYLGKLRDQ